MTQISVSKEIHANAEKTWEVIADYSNIHKFHNQVETADQLTENDRGLGAIRQCNFYGGGNAVEKVVAWNEGESMSIDIIDGSLPFNSANAHVSVKPIDDTKSEVTFRMEFSAKYGLIGKVMEKLMMPFAMRRAFKQLLEGLDTHIQTGNLIGKGGKQIAA